MNWLLYDRDLRHERFNCVQAEELQVSSQNVCGSIALWANELISPFSVSEKLADKLLVW